VTQQRGVIARGADHFALSAAANVALLAAVSAAVFIFRTAGV
jgi:hypothetical protein